MVRQMGVTGDTVDILATGIYGKYYNKAKSSYYDAVPIIVLR